MSITPRAPYGSLLKPDRPSKPKKVARLLGRNPRVRNETHIEAVRQCPCLACGVDPCGEAAHIRYSEPDRPNPGMAQKAHDVETVPLCRLCHLNGPDAQHRHNERAFWDRLRIDPLKVAAALAKVSPQVEQMRAVVFAVRAIVVLGRDAR